jgi:Family of unknown function (DUF5946)
MVETETQVIARCDPASDLMRDELLARDFQEIVYWRYHRLAVDAYCLQHPLRYCESAKSLAAHLCGLCIRFEMSPIDRGEWANHWCWSFTEVSIRQLFQRRFTSDTLHIKTHGNVFAAMAFLQGVSLEEIDRGKLDIHDQAYPVIITLRVQKR